jgi:hypothetical protein
MKKLVVILLLAASFGAGFYVGKGPSEADSSLLQGLQHRISDAGQAIGHVAQQAQARFDPAFAPAPQQSQAQPPEPEGEHLAAAIERPVSAKRPVSINGRLYMIGTD